MNALLADFNPFSSAITSADNAATAHENAPNPVAVAAPTPDSAPACGALAGEAATQNAASPAVFILDEDERLFIEQQFRVLLEIIEGTI